MTTGLTYTRGRQVHDTVEGGAVPRVPSRFTHFPGVRIEEATTNLVANPSVETNTTGYAVRNGGDVIAQSSEEAYAGEYSLKVTPDNAANGGAFNSISGIAAATDYTASVYVYMPTGCPPLTVEVHTQGHAAFIASLSVPSVYDEWQRVVLPFTTPGGTTGLTVDVRKDASADTDPFYIDALQVEAKEYATTYCDGAAGEGHGWTGTAHGSTSTRAAGKVYISEGATTNLVTNPSFEVDDSGWTDILSATMTRITSDAVVGAACAQVVTPATDLAGTEHSALLVSGVTYQFSVYVKGAVGGETLKLLITDNAGTPVTSANFTATAAWTRQSLQYTAASSANYRFRVVNNGATARTFKLDAVQIEAWAEPTSYTDGTLGDGYAWTGTPHASTSTRAGSSVLDETSGGVAFWVTFPDAQDANRGTARLLTWIDDADDHIRVEYDHVGEQFAMGRVGGGTGENGPTQSKTIAAGESVLVIAGWDATTTYLSVNGGPRASTAQSTVPVLDTVPMVIGSQWANDLYSNAIFEAVAFFNRPLTNAEAAAYAALERPPVFGEVAGSAMTGLWYGAHSVAWSLAADGATIDLNDATESDIRLLGLAGAGAPPLLNRVVETPLRDGASFIDTRLKTRFIGTSLLLQGVDGWSAIWAKRAEILQVLNPRRGRGVLMFAPDTEVFEIEAALEGGLEFNSPVGAFAQQATVIFRCDDPAWRVSLLNEVSLADGLPTEVVNEGDLPVYPQVRLTMTATAVIDPQIANGEVVFTLDDTFDDIDSVEIDMDARTVRKSTGADIIGRRTPASQMWALAPGANTVTVSAGTGSATGRLRWATRRIGL